MYLDGKGMHDGMTQWWEGGAYLEDDGLGRDDDGGDVYGSYGITAMILRQRVGFAFAFTEKKERKRTRCIL